MLSALKQRNPGRGVAAILFYQFIWLIARGVSALVYRLRVTGTENIPAEGAVIVVANHQSHLDPEVVSMAFWRRHVIFIAKAELFKNPLFGWFIGVLNSVPIQQGAADLGAIRTAIEQLEMGRLLLMFPEGTRTPDGAMHPFKRGAWLVLSRSKATVLPVAVEGAFDAFPRGRKFPRLFGRRIAVRVGKPIPAAELLAMKSEVGLEHLRKIIEGMRMELAADLAKRGHPVTTKPMSGVEIL